MNPEVPMALRLQGNLLYGVSRVYSRQCVYTLTDVQAMHDRMKTALKVIHGRGLDPEAGKARYVIFADIYAYIRAITSVLANVGHESPEELIVPYDPAFIPELSLPGLNLDLVNIHTAKESSLNLHSSLLSSNLSNSDHSRAGIDALPQLDISSPSIALGETGGFTLASDRASSTQKDNYRFRGSAFEDEEGVLLQPDFEFDEDGNIVDLVTNELSVSRADEQTNLQQSELTVRDRVSADARRGTLPHQQQNGEPMDLDHDNDYVVAEDMNGSPERRSPRSGRHSDPEYVEGVEETSETRNAGMSRKKRACKKVEADECSQISRTELVRLEDEYLQNMSLASKQKKHNKDLTQAKKNALFWVVGGGIGSVGMGLGVSRTSHPLQEFCGEQLLAALGAQDVSDDTRRKRGLSFHGDDVSSDEGRRVRPRVDEEIETDLPRGDELAFGDADVLMQEEVEIGRHAPPSLQDDASSQMPWNITASIQGSIHGSASSRPFESMELSSRGQLGGFSRFGGRFINSSPLAGRGLAVDRVGHDRL
ncbi:Rad21/Rec8 N terminal domain protein, partial [Rasamsonia emersonii CBS 393.64]